MKRPKRGNKQTRHKKLLSTKAGTATSSPVKTTPSPTDKIFASLWYMKKEAYAETTIYATGKRLRHMKNNCTLGNPEDVKGFIANKNCTNAYKESLAETYNTTAKQTT